MRTYHPRDSQGERPAPRSKEWTADSVRVNLTGSDIYFHAPCGEYRYMSVIEAKKLAKRITELAQSWARQIEQHHPPHLLQTEAPMEPIIQTDLNERERTRYAELCRSMARELEEISKALIDKDDDKAMLSFVVFSMQTSGLAELRTIIMDAMKRKSAEVKGKSIDFLPPDDVMRQL